MMLFIRSLITSCSHSDRLQLRCSYTDGHGIPVYIGSLFLLLKPAATVRSHDEAVDLQVVEQLRHYLLADEADGCLEIVEEIEVEHLDVEIASVTRHPRGQEVVSTQEQGSTIHSMQQPRLRFSGTVIHEPVLSIVNLELEGELGEVLVVVERPVDLNLLVVPGVQGRELEEGRKLRGFRCE